MKVCIWAWYPFLECQVNSKSDLVLSGATIELWIARSMGQSSSTTASELEDPPSNERCLIIEPGDLAELALLRVLLLYFAPDDVLEAPLNLWLPDDLRLTKEFALSSTVVRQSGVEVVLTMLSNAVRYVEFVRVLTTEFGLL